MGDNKRFYFTIKAILIKNDKFLIIHRSNKARGDFHYWELPGGRLEFTESPIEALKREISEETGCEIICSYPISTWSFFKNENTQVIGVTYAATVKDMKIKLSSEHDDFAWISSGEISKYNIYPALLEEFSKLNWEKIKEDLLSIENQT